MPRLYFKGAPAERFAARVVEIGSGCWEWNGYRGPKGYGKFGLTPSSTVLAHRFAWEQEHGPIPEGMCVLHRCDNPPCVNPAHLFLGTLGDNNNDMRAKGRGTDPPRRTGEQSPSARLTASQVAEIRGRFHPRVVTQKMLASEFDVSVHTVAAIVQGRLWAAEWRRGIAESAP